MTDSLRPSRRAMLSSLGAGFGAFALADLLHAGDASSPSGPRGLPGPHVAPRAKHVIFLFMGGGPSHLDLFDPKPQIARHAGQRPDGTALRTERVTGGLLPSPFAFEKCGEAGIEISELLPHLRTRADELCVIRSLHGVNPNHGPAANHLFSGRIDQIHPALGAWVAHGLGSENADLPALVSLRDGDTASKHVRHGYLPGTHPATPIDPRTPDPAKMIRHLRDPQDDRTGQLRELEFLRALDREHLAERPGDAQLEARIAALETAFRMQFAAGDALDLAAETQSTRTEYGEGWFANSCLVARRLVERGVRYVHLEHRNWDHHEKITSNIRKTAAEIDRPIAALLADLRRRGLLDETLVAWGGEFGRTPVSENGDGRDHNHYGFTVWLAGGGVRGGHVHGATDEFGFRAVQNRVSVNDLHATMLHLLGLDHERLTFRHSGRDFRLTDVAGRVVTEILA